MSTEIEAKFAVADRASWERIRALNALGRYTLLGTRVHDVRDEYVDTPERALLSAGYACRRRQQAADVVITLKSVLSPPGELHRREELEVSLSAGPAPFSVEAWPASAARSRVLELVGTRELQVLFRLHQARIIRDLVDGSRQVALFSLDEVSLSVPGGSPQRWWELELELAAGAAEAWLLEVGAWVRTNLGLQPSAVSKFERALEAVQGR